MYYTHKILEAPLGIETEYDDDLEIGSPSKVNDEIYFVSHSHFLKTNIYFGIGGVIFGLWLLWSIETIKITFDLILPIICITGGSFWLIYGLFVKKKHKIFKLERLKGLVTYPDNYFHPPLKGKFKDLKVVIAVTGNIDGYVDREYLKFVNTFKPRKVDLLYTFYGDPKKDWSFMVWYMDKNRPLPPGTAFDPYRQKDFERRKNEGFPKPLYPSNIPTPEATPEQQKERENIGGW